MREIFQPQPPGAPAFSAKPALFLSWVAALLWLGLGGAFGVLAFSSCRGLEGTDEASYLLAAKNPWASPGYGLFFGFPLHLLWQLTGHVGSFRFAGMLALVAAAFGFGYLLVRASPFLGAGGIFSKVRMLIFPSLAIAALARYTVGIRTPGYDWLLLFSALAFASAWLGVESRPSHQRPTWLWGFLALGGTGILLAKWTAFPGYVLLAAALIFFKFRGGERARAAGALLLWSLGWVSLFILWATPEGVVETIRSGFAQMATGSHSGLIRHYAVGFLKGSWQVIRALPWIAVLYGGVWGILRILRGSRPALAETAGFSFLAGLVLALARGYWLGGQTTFSKGMMITVVWLAGTYFMCRPYQSAGSRSRLEETATFRRVAAMLALLPLLNGAGTATGITDYLGHGAVFYAALGWIFLGWAAARGLPVGCLAAAVFCLGLIQASRVASTTLNTYRVGSVWVPEMVPLTAGPERGRLWTFPLAAECLQKIHGQMERAGFRPGDPVIGITDCPGLVYLLGGTSPGVCWYISYYLPENPGVRMNLLHINPERLARSWVVVRESARASERLETVWPEDKGIPRPVPIDGDFYWPTGDAGGKAERIVIYRPASSGLSLRR